MSRGQNTIKRSEISTTPALLKYSASYDSSSFTAKGITVNRGINSSYSSNGVNYLNFALVKQLYYQEYLTGSLKFSSSFWDPSIQSTAASGTFDLDNRYFPTESNAEITVIGIPRTAFGEQIARKTLLISGSTYSLIDDGNGNVIDSKNSNAHVGNVLYSQGVIVLTNLDYAYAMIPSTIPTTTTTSTTTTTTTPAPTTTTTTTTTTTVAPTTTSTTTTTTTAAPTTTSTTTTTTTVAPTTSTTTTTTTESPTTTTTTTTTTTEAPTTTTSTTTTTTTAAVTITLFAAHDAAASTFPSVQFAYSTDGGTSWTNVGSSFTDTSCNQRATITVAQGSSLSLKLSDAGNVNNTWQTARDNSTCPTFTGAQCTWPALTNINRSYYFTINGDNQGTC